VSDRFEDTVLGTLNLTDANGYAINRVDLGFPVARVVSSERVNANGVDDVSAFYGARAVAVQVSAYGAAGITRKAALDRLRAYASPARRPYLYWDEALDGHERRVRLRGDAVTWPMDNPVATDVQLTFVAPDGVIEDASATTVAVAAAAAPEAGRSYPRTYPLTYPATSAVGTVDALNAGTEPAAPVLALWGPCTDPTLANLTTGEQIVFTGTVLTAEQYIEVDVREATVRLNGRVDQSLYDHLDLTATSLFWLAAGSNLLRYSPATYGAGAQATCVYRSAWL
jgi:hypothetical protein